MANYVDKSLAHGEEILRRGRWPLIMWVWAWVMLALAVALLIWGLVAQGWQLWLFGILALPFLFMFASLALRMSTTEFAVTTQRIILKSGWLDRKTAELAVASIEGVHLNQSIWERMWGYGKLVVTGTGDAVTYFPPMAEPVAFRRAIESSRAIGRDGHITDEELRSAQSEGSKDS